MSRYMRAKRSSWTRLLSLLGLIVATSLANYATVPLTPAHATTGTFANPLSSTSAYCCQDPTAFYKDGYYYFAYAEAETIIIHKSSTLEDIASGPLARKVIDVASFTEGDIWAPEIFFASGNWYLYASYVPTGGVPRHAFVVQASTQDPMAGWGSPAAFSFPGWTSAHHSNDANFFQNGSSQYIVFAGYAAGGPYGIHIAPLTNPSTVSATPVLINRVNYTSPGDPGPNPALNWEQPYVENPAVVIKNGKVNLAYSANDYASENYTTGLMTYSSGNILSAASWTKKTSPIFSKTATVLGPGGVSFTKSPDGLEDWIVYHAKIRSTSEGLRHLMAQKFTWNGSNEVVLGTPIGETVAQNRPSGEPDTNRSYRVYQEAEDATQVGTTAPAFHLYAAGFLSVGGLDSSGDHITFDWVNVPNAGTYRLVIRYLATPWFSATQPIYLNGSGTPINVNLPARALEDPGQVSLDVSLAAGKNTVKFGNNGGLAEIDSILLPRLEAEHGTLLGTPSTVARSNARNGVAVGNLNWPTDCVVQSLKVPAFSSNTYTLRARASAGWGAATQAVTVNGASAGTLSYAGTADWNTFTTATIAVGLNAGFNTIQICKSGSGYAELDAIEWY